MNFKQLRLFCLLSLFVLLVEFGSKLSIAVEQPNVVLFLVDDMGWTDCGVYGSKYYETPNIDRFAKRAMRFTDAYSNPLCSPTRASIMSGKYATRHGILTASGHQPPQPVGHNYLPDTAAPNRLMISPESKNYLELSEQTIAETLRAAGYRTAHIGKWHLGLTDEYRPDKQGFDVTFHCAPDPGPPGNYFSPYGVTPNIEPNGKQRAGNITDGPAGEYIVDRQASEAVKFINESKGKPFFLNLWCYGVHGPWGHKAEYTAEFAKKSDPTGLQGNPIMASMLRSVDECFGRIVDELDQQGLTEKTIVIFYSDNGGNTHSNVPGTAKTGAAEKSRSEAMSEWRRLAGNRPPTNNSPLRDGKGTLYEGGTRVPMMWSWGSKIPSNTTNASVVGHIDIYPTLLDLIGVKKPASQHLDGTSLANVLKENAVLDRKAFFNYFPYRPNEGGVTVRSGDYKMIRWFDPGVRPELYNLRDDIGESKNLADSQPAKVSELNLLIDAFLRETGALVPKLNPIYQPKQAAPTKPSASNSESIDSDVIVGLVPKQCKIKLVVNAIRVEADGKKPFLGTAQVKHSGPMLLKLRARTPTGGSGLIQWRTADQEAFPLAGQTVDFHMDGKDDWQDIVVSLPIDGQSGTIRLYLPAADSPVELQSIEFLSKDTGKSVKHWDFTATSKTLPGQQTLDR
jgi:arylsulfatase A-like enzyme